MSRVPRYVLLSFLALAALFLSTEIWLQATRHTSFCTTSSCDVVGEYIRFGEGNLIKMGATFFWILWGLVFFAGRYDKTWLWGSALLIFAGALAFDGALLGFQFVGLKEKCALCIVVAATLFVGLGLLAWTRHSWQILMLGLAIWSGGFLANAVLDLQVIPPMVQNTAFVSYGQDNSTGTRHTLFFSLNCDHCSKILANLSINTENLSGQWDLACVDNKEEDFFRLAAVLHSTAGRENPFLEVLRQETLEHPQALPISDTLRQATRTARAYFKISGFQGIPVLIVQERPGWEMALRGETNIMEYLRTRNFVQRELNFFQSAPPEHNSTQDN